MPYLSQIPPGQFSLLDQTAQLAEWITLYPGTIAEPSLVLGPHKTVSLSHNLTDE